MSRILVIDDSPGALEMIRAALTEAGHQVATETDGASGIQLLRREPFDLIITDIYMPGRDGLEVIRECRRMRPEAPVIVISGKTGNWSMLAVAKRLGARQSVQKPFSRFELLNAVEAVLRSTNEGGNSQPS